ncbi:MAG: cytochrome b/b6 domain-containing protein [Selenomonadaceae bacterium]|nr:cytochrome b/b6 domain-containing protein [Selenomonadaceae bacterium]
MLVNNRYVPRHKKSFMICHWLNGISFLMLFLTALPLYADTFLFMYNIFGAKTLQYLHRFFAVIFIATPIFGLLSAREGYMTLFKQVASFGRDDLIFLLKFPLTLIGIEPSMPKQGFYNGGEKINILLQAVIWLVLVVSGLILWLGNGVIDNSIRAWMIPLHSIAAGIGFAAALAHIYLAVVQNPDSLHGMTDGSIHADYACHHHGAWVDELIENGTVTKKEIDAARKAA